jgi:hypothetical protein
VGDGRHSFLKAHDSDHGQNEHCVALRQSDPVYSDCPGLFEYVDLFKLALMQR